MRGGNWRPRSGSWRLHMASCRRRRLCMASCRRSACAWRAVGRGDASTTACCQWASVRTGKHAVHWLRGRCAAAQRASSVSSVHSLTGSLPETQTATAHGLEVGLRCPQLEQPPRAAAQLCSARTLAILVLLCHLGEVLQGALLDPGLVARDVRVHLLVKAAPRDPVMQRHDASSRAGQEATTSGLSHKRAHVLHVVDEVEKVCAPHTALTPSPLGELQHASLLAAPCTSYVICLRVGLSSFRRFSNRPQTPARCACASAPPCGATRRNRLFRVRRRL